MLRQQLKFDNLIVADTMTMTAVLEGRTAAETAVLAVRAGCDVLIGPGDLEDALTALERAYDDGTLEPERVKHSVRRRLKWAQWASPPNDWRRPSGADTAWGALLADKVLRVEYGPLPVVGTVTEMAIVDDDHDADGPAVERTGIAEAMRLGGNDARIVDAPTPASGGPFVIALFADYVAGKGRTTLLPETVARVYTLVAQADALQRSVILIGLGHPRWVAQLGMTQPTVLAWGGDRVMQQAAGRGLLRHHKK